jgi:hypothetical protein
MTPRPPPGGPDVSLISIGNIVRMNHNVVIQMRSEGDHIGSGALVHFCMIISKPQTLL